MSYWPASADDATSHTLFVVEQDAAGRHVVDESRGVRTAGFRDHHAAVAFARRRSRRTPGSIVLVRPVQVAARAA